MCVYTCFNNIVLKIFFPLINLFLEKRYVLQLLSCYGRFVFLSPNILLFAFSHSSETQLQGFCLSSRDPKRYTFYTKLCICHRLPWGLSTLTSQFKPKMLNPYKAPNTLMLFLDFCVQREHCHKPTMVLNNDKN